MSRRVTPAGVTYGVDVGGTKVLGVALADDGAVVAEHRVPTPFPASDDAPDGRTAAPGTGVARAVVAVVAALASDVARAGHGTARGLGLGVPGMVDADGRLRFSPHLTGAHDVDLQSLVAARLAEAFGSPPGGAGALGVHARNDANCAALAELTFGAARGATDVLVVTLGTGIGGALVLGGKVRSGAHGFAGEIGHMVVDPNGPPCPCGGRGCWERFASGGGLARLAREAALAGTLTEAVRRAGGDPELVRGEHVTAAAADGDPGARDVVEELGWWLGLGLANLVAVCDPELVVVGGGLARAGEMLLGPARRALAALVEGGKARGEVPVVAASLGPRAGAIGAALALWEG